MDNYYTKYIKYKNKYIELKKVNDGTYYTKNITEKGQVGGVLGTDPCPHKIGFFGLTFGSVWYYLRTYNCTYKHLIEKIPNKVDAITYADFQRTNRDNKQNPLTVSDLRSRGFPLGVFKKAGFPLDVLKYAGIPLQELKEEFSIYELKQVGFTLDILKYAGIPLQELKEEFNIYELKKAGFPLGVLKDAGIPLQELKEEFNIYELKQAGFTLQELKAHFTLKQLNIHFTLQEIREKGVSAKELKEAGFSAKELKEAGFTLEDLIRSQFTYNELFQDGIHIDYININNRDKHLEDIINRLDNPELIMDILEGNKDVNLLELELSIIELKKGGITAKKLKDSGAHPRELVDAGFTLKELKDVFNEEDDIDKFKMDEFSAKELYDAGFTLQFLYSGGRLNYRYNLDKLVQIVRKNNDDKYDQIETLKKAGFSDDHIQIYYPYPVVDGYESP